MTIAEREAQIIRIKEASFQSELDEQLEKHLTEQVVQAVQATIEAALVEKLQADLLLARGLAPKKWNYWSAMAPKGYWRR